MNSRLEEVMLLGRSLMYIRKRRGPKTEPCGTPEDTGPEMLPKRPRLRRFTWPHNVRPLFIPARGGSQLLATLPSSKHAMKRFRVGSRDSWQPASCSGRGQSLILLTRTPPPGCRSFLAANARSLVPAPTGLHVPTPWAYCSRL